MVLITYYKAREKCALFQNKSEPLPSLFREFRIFIFFPGRKKLSPSLFFRKLSRTFFSCEKLARINPIRVHFFPHDSFFFFLLAWLKDICKPCLLLPGTYFSFTYILIYQLKVIFDIILILPARRNQYYSWYSYKLFGIFNLLYNIPALAFTPIYN